MHATMRTRQIATLTDSTRSLAVAKRPCDYRVGQFWLITRITGRQYFADIIGFSSTIVM